MRALLSLLVALTLLGCGGAKPGLKLTAIDASVQHPSNIAIYFTVDADDGAPVAGLTAESFRIYEDGQPVSALESRQTILNPEVAAAHFTLLLIDMSGSVTESDDLPVILSSARAFAERVEKYQKVAVYAFDGSSDIHSVVDFASGAALKSGIERLSGFQARDPSTNLNGAVLAGLKVLRHKMRSSPLPLTFGTLVVFTDGTDRAHRVPREKLHEALASAEVGVLVIGVGAEADEAELRRIGKAGAIVSKDRAQIAASFEAAARWVEAFSRRYYLLGYCSPARAGEHELSIQTSHGKESGTLTYRFHAEGFKPDCDPTQRPSFSLKRPRKGDGKAAAVKPDAMPAKAASEAGGHFGP